MSFIVSAYCFVSEKNVVFVTEFCVLVLEDRSVWGNYLQFYFRNPVNSGILRSGSSHSYLRKPFVF